MVSHGNTVFGMRRFVLLCACLVTVVWNCLCAPIVVAEEGFHTRTVSGLTSAYHIISADFNGDSIADLAVTQWTENKLTVLLGDGLGGFSSGAVLNTGVHPNFIAAGNLDNGGGIDLAVSNGGGQRDVTLAFNDGSGTLWSMSNLGVGNDADITSIVAANLTSNTDPDVDLFIVKDSGVTSDFYEVWRGDGDGSFGEFQSGTGATGSMPIFAATADLNGDTKPDIIVANYYDNSISVLLGNGDGTLSETPASPIDVGVLPRSVATGYLNGDTHVDLVIPNLGDNTITVLLGNGDGTFTYGETLVGGDQPASAAIADFDGDGFNDVAVTMWLDDVVSVFYGKGDGTFRADPTLISVGTRPFFIVAADLDKDGRTDMAVTNYQSNDVTIILNKVSVCLAPPGEMVSLWSGDGHPFDLVGTHHGTMMNGAAYEPGKVGRAFSLDGTDDYVEVGSGLGSFGSAPFTIDFWLYSRNDGDNTYIVGKSHPDHGLGWDIRLNANAVRVAGIDGWAFNITSDASITPNRWHHVALSADETTATLYINGIPKGTSPRSTISDTTNPARIGYTTNFGGTAFSGLIDEVAVHSRALTEEEVGAIYHTGGVGRCRPCFPAPSGLVSWWTGDGSAADAAGSNHGTMSGGGFAQGKVAQAFSFDGVDDHVALPDLVSTLVENSGGTITAWVNPTAVGDNDIVVAFGSGGNGQGIGLGVWGNVRIYHHTGAYDWQSDTPVSANEWTMLTYTWDGTTERIYKNGMFTESRPRNFSYVPGQARIGHGFWNDSANAFPGLIDEVQVFSRPLSAEVIAAIHGAGGAGVCVPEDTTPDQFTFIDQTDVALTTLIESNVITVTGINAPAAISIEGGEFSIDGGDYTSAQGTVNNNQTVRVRQVSSSSYATTTNTTVTIGGVSDTFSVTTVAPPEYTITFSSSGNGEVVCEPATVVLGNTSVCTITPDPGYVLVRLTDNGSDVTQLVSSGIYSIDNVTEDHAVEAVFGGFTFSPDRGTLGTVVELSGPAFGTRKGKIYLEKDGVRYATKVSEWNAGGTSNVVKAVVTKTPPQGLYRIVAASKDRGEMISHDFFEIMVPEIGPVSVGIVDGKKVVTIVGRYFGSRKKPKVYLNDGTKDFACKVKSFTDATIQCYPHKAFATGTYTVKVIVGNTLKGEAITDIDGL